MTEITATYISSSSFTIPGSKLDEFSPGRAVWANCGADGVRYAFVASSSYSSPDTTVVLDTFESQSLTSNLVSVLFGRVKYGLTKGNEPLQDIWTKRGHRHGLELSYKDSDEIYINGGAIHIDDGSSENIYACQSQLTKTCSVSGSQWYGVYVDPPATGLVLTADDIEVSTSIPTYDHAKQGWYHSTGADQRCIGFLLVTSGSIVAFKQVGSRVFMPVVQDYSGTPSNTWTTATLTCPIGNCIVMATISGGYSNSSTWAEWRNKTLTSILGRLVYTHSTSEWLINNVEMIPDANKQIEVAFWNATTNLLMIHSYGYVLPEGF